MVWMAVGGWAASQATVPEWLSESALPFVFLGLIVGLMIGLTSIGAGAIATPVLILFLETPPLAAVGSAIVAGAVSKAVGAWRHSRRGAFDSKLVRSLLAGSVPGVGVAVMALYLLRHQSLAVANVWVDRLLGLALVLLGLSVLARDTGWVRRWQAGEGHPSLVRRGVLIGVVVGVVFGATSIGTGSLLVLLLSIFLSLSEVRVVGTAIFYGFVISLFASILHIAWGTVSWPLVGWLLLGSLPGVMIGSELAARAPRRFLRACFSLGAVWAGWKLI
ncbi:MAG: sulfite exporter TauE/SafE family protein [Terriglobia bacterium]